MSDPDLSEPASWAAILTAIDPGLGGLALTARASPQREAWVQAFLTLTNRPHRRIGPSTGDDRLFGGLDLTATLSAGHPVQDPGLLADLGAGTLVLPMAERLSPDRAVRLAQTWDAGARFTVLALDEAAEDDGRVPTALLDRLAFHVTLTPHPQREARPPFHGI
ncbi:MAG: magnesium chelatase ATPase subunit D, partial [Pseudomonadota bacterium]